MTERSLFYAYRNLDSTYSAECACGDLIVAPDGDEDTVAEAVNLHNESPVHAQWREWQAAVDALKRPPRKSCPCHGHAA